MPFRCRALSEVGPEGVALANKKVYICFLVAIAMLAASPMRAAGSDRGSAAAPAPGNPSSQRVVVRVDPRTGKLVRSPAPAPVQAPVPKHKPEISALAEQAARAHQVDPALVDSVIQVESNYNPYAVSSKGAEGVMQLMPPTARMLGVSNSFDPQQNIEAGVKYLKYLQDLYKDDRLALAAYNAGPAAVEKYKWVPPIRETQNYVNEVGRRYGDAKKSPAPAAAPASAEVKGEEKPADTPVAEQHPRLEQFIDEHGRLHLKTAH